MIKSTGLRRALSRRWAKIAVVEQVGWLGVDLGISSIGHREGCAGTRWPRKAKPPRSRLRRALRRRQNSTQRQACPIEERTRTSEKHCGTLVSPRGVEVNNDALTSRVP